MPAVRTADPLDYSEKELHAIFEKLRFESLFFKQIANTVDVTSWVSINMLLDQGKSPEEVARAHGLPAEFVDSQVIHARACLKKYKHDFQKLKACLEHKLVG
jgi:hypothetical protein